MPRTVSVELGERSYNIHIGSGLLAEAGTLCTNVLGKGKCAVVTDSNVANLHLAALESVLKEAGIYAGSIVVPAGEGSKSFSQLSDLSEQLLKLNVERGDAVIAFGGGMVGDLAGFAASILRRGVRMIQIPTSLLSQVDSSVGGKTGINTPQGKNLIGAFHQPSLVIADTNVLKTLSGREFASGYAEVVKYGLLGDADFFGWLEEYRPALFSDEGDAREKAIETSCLAKAAVVAEDEKEAGRRALLNLGHTFGHAIEAWAGYSGRVLHGEGVSIGMTMAFEFSERIGICSVGVTSRVEAHLRAAGLPTRISDIPGEDYPTAEILRGLMQQDKKVKDGNLAFILVRDIGDAYVDSNVPMDKLQEFLIDMCP
ncbi:MAG: 3-dehydroquinate synthase [Methyloligellaceae bacterium]